MSETTRSFPRQVECGGSPVEVHERDALTEPVAVRPQDAGAPTLGP